jgi:aquaporin Z
MGENMKKYIAEFIGTMVLTVFGCGSAVAANTILGTAGQGKMPLAFSTLLIAFAFGLSIVAMAYSIGNISGCHINPAVSFAMWLTGKLNGKDFIGYLVAQFIGATVGAALLVLFFGSNKSLGTNGYGTASALGVSAGVAFVVEMVLTYVFVTAILGVTSKREYSPVAGLVIGLTLTLVHILGIPFTGTSVNPARSFGPAVMSGFGSLAFQQLWVFIVAPLLGAGIAAFVYKYLSTGSRE